MKKETKVRRPTYDEWCEDWFLAELMDGERQHADIDPELLAEYEERLEREGQDTKIDETKAMERRENMATLDHSDPDYETHEEAASRIHGTIQNLNTERQRGKTCGSTGERKGNLMEVSSLQ